MSACNLTIMVPCLNEAETLLYVLTRIQETLERNHLEAEILVVDNGSTDESVQIAQSVGACVVHEAQAGYGYAVRRGLSAARGKYIIYADADGSYDFAYIKEIYAALTQPDFCDIVLGSRYHGHLHPRAMPWTHRYLGTPFLTGCINFLFRTKYLDCNCGMRGLRKDILPLLDLQSGGMELSSEMLIRAVQTKVRVHQIPLDFMPDRRSGSSHLRTIRDGFRHLHLIIRSRFFPTAPRTPAS